jgi:hypothetical protein
VRTTLIFPSHFATWISAFLGMICSITQVRPEPSIAKKRQIYCAAYAPAQGKGLVSDIALEWPVEWRAAERT